MERKKFKISVGVQGRLVTFRVHPESYPLFLEGLARVPAVAIEADHDGPYDFEGALWWSRVLTVATMLTGELDTDYELVT